MLIRSIFRFGKAFVLPGFVLATLFAAPPVCALAQSAGITQISGTVVDAERRPVGDAEVRLSGPTTKTTTTAADGSFAFVNLPAGTFRLDISKGGFNPATQEDITTVAGSTTNLSFILQSASLTSLTVIGNVSVAAHGANAINTTPASVVDVPASTFTDQGELSLNHVLNEIPGITVGVNGNPCGNNSGASPFAAGITSIRGGLPYETESLIDGHQVALGGGGQFSPSFLTPYELQNVEVVKGPGATSPSINYAINGTVNYRTLEPTLKPEESVDVGYDQYGGNFANFRATGTLPGGRLSYAFDYETQGTQGDERGLDGPVLFFPLGPLSLNGQSVNAFGPGYSEPLGPNKDLYNSFSNVVSFLMCCPSEPMWAVAQNELGKIRYAFTPETALTVTWLGGQGSVAQFGQGLYLCPWTVFAPPTGYSGQFPAGSVADSYEGPSFNMDEDQQRTNLFETEFHTPIGKTATLQLRQYASSIVTFSGGPGDSGPTAAGTSYITGALYGGVDLGGSNTPTIFNGQIETFSVPQYLGGWSYNDLNGYTAEIDKQAGDDLLSLSYDEQKTSTLGTSFIFGNCYIQIPRGSNQTFQSVMGRAQFVLGQYVTGTVSDNFGSYTNTYTQNAGLTFQSATHTYEAPRLSLTWRPNANQSVRGSLGESVAPPFIAQLNNNNQITSGTGDPARYFVGTANTGDLLPETAFGFDIGFDTRIHSPYTVLSMDAYQTLLHDQFLSETIQDGTYTCTNPNALDFGQTGPLFLTKTANLGHSEYEGIELSLHRDPPTGWGYKIQGSLMRAFVYDLPAGFYSTAAGPYETNLGILPNENFDTSGYAYNGMSSARVPYSTGYGELSYRGHNGAYFLVGITYYGPNNSYNEPAFEVVTASFDQPLSRRMSLQLSVYNLTNVYPALYYTYYGPDYTPLANGYVGASATQPVGPTVARLTLHVGF